MQSPVDHGRDTRAVHRCHRRVGRQGMRNGCTPLGARSQEGRAPLFPTLEQAQEVGTLRTGACSATLGLPKLLVPTTITGGSYTCVATQKAPARYIVGNSYQIAKKRRCIDADNITRPALRAELTAAHRLAASRAPTPQTQPITTLDIDALKGIACQLHSRARYCVASVLRSGDEPSKADSIAQLM